MEPKTFYLVHDQARQGAAAFVRAAPQGWRVRVEPAKRSLDQNAAQWPILEAFSKQLKWPVDGEMVYIEPEDWKNVLSAAFKRERVRIAQGLNGGFVMLGQRTSKFSKAEFSEWLDFLNATATHRGVDLEA